MNTLCTMRQLVVRAAALTLTAVSARRLRGATAALAALVIVAAAAPAEAQRFERGLLWRIDGTGAPASHVFGTIHVDDPRVTKLPTAVARELNDARSLTLEVAFDPSQMLALGTACCFSTGATSPARRARSSTEKPRR